MNPLPEQLKQTGFRFCRLNGKVPVDKDWPNTNNYSYDSIELSDWTGNIGVVCGYKMLMVLDFDSIDFYNLFKDKLPVTFTVRSGGKNLPHLYYFIKDLPEGVNSVPNLKVDKLDIKGDGGQVVAPGSKITRADGTIGEYVVENNIPITTISYHMISSLFIKTTEGIRRKGEKTLLKEGAPKGERNDSYFKLACVRRNSDVSYDIALEEIKLINEKNGDPLPESEIITLVNSAYSYTDKIFLKIDNYYDNVERFYTIRPFFYDENKLFWMWDTQKYCYMQCDDTTLLRLINIELSFAGQTVRSSIKTNYLEAFRIVGRGHIPIIPQKNWIQFKNTIVDIKKGDMFEATPEYFMCNPIPWKLGTNGSTPTIDKLFTDWVGSGVDKEQLYEIIAYCCLANYPIHTIISLIGCGRNGKGSYIQILERFIGANNIISSELDDLLGSRFEKAKLYKKLVCVMGETNFGTITRTGLLKKLASQDLIGFEFKGKNPFNAHNYAKIIIASNSLPITADDTDGFFRRWLSMKFSNLFPEGSDIYETVPEIEYEELAFKVTQILPKLLAKGSFVNQGTIQQRKERYISASNPITLFIDECCIVDDTKYVKAKDLYFAYVQYLNRHKKRLIKRKEFNQALAEEGYQAEHCDKKKVNSDIYLTSWWIEGLMLK